MANLAAHKRTRQVDAASKLERLIALTDAGLDVVSRLGVTILFNNYGRFDIGYDPSVPLYQVDDAPAVRELLGERTEEDVHSRVFAGYAGHTLYDLDSTFAAGPINHPVYFEISNRYVDIDAAMPHLEAHPLVRAITYDPGRPGAYDHVASSLKLVVALPDGIRSKIEKETSEYYKRISRKGERSGAGPSDFERAFTWSLTNKPKAYGDLLGLSKFARKHGEYKEPSEDDAFNEWD
jgi:hypothetical protein